MQIYFDMDGVLAIWDPSNTAEDTRKPGYFAERDIDPAIRDFIKLLAEDGNDVTILSATYLTTSARQEKAQWLKDNGIDIPAIYVPYGLSKQDFIPDTGDNCMVLIDDYSTNLHSWVSESDRHIGIKYLNGINGNNGSWDGPYITPDMKPEEMYQVLRIVA